MKYYFFFLILFAFFSGINAQEMDVKAINKKITEIRQNTNWDDAVAAKKANEEIKLLSKQLMLVKQKINTNKPSTVDEIKKENVEANSKIWDQMMKSFDKGKEADLLLGTPIREEIIEKYKNDESPLIKNPEVFQEQTLLVIDMSLKTVQRTIDQMDKFKSIKTLIISGGKFGMPVNLSDLLKRAKNYPLEELYIINFRQFVKSIPNDISRFKNLSLLSTVGNQLTNLPTEVSSFSLLMNLYIDANPISTILSVVSKIKSLENLGVGKTNISKTELEKIAQLNPNCKILLQ